MPIVTTIIRYGLPLVVLAVLGLIHLPYPFGGDQALFLLGAAALDRGEVLYVGFWDNKQPGIYFFFWLAGHLFGFSEVGVHLLELLWQALLAIVLISTLRPYFEIHWLSSLVPLSTIGAYYCSAQGHLLTQLEILVPLPLFACLWLSSYSWSAARTCKAAHFASGCCAAIAAVFKLILMPIPVTFWLASAAWAIAREGRPPGTVLRDQLLPATTGVVVVFGAVTAYFAMLGALPEFLWTNLGYPVQAVATTTNVLDWERLLFSAGWYAFTFAPWLLFAALGLTGCRGDRRDLVTLQLALWLLVGTALTVAQRLSWWSYHFLLLILPLGILALRGIDAVSIRLAGGGAVDRRRLVPLVAVLAYAPLTAGLQGLFGKVQPVIALSVMGDTDLVGYRGWVEPEYYQIWRDTRFLVGPGALPGPIYVFGDPRYYLLSGRTQAIPIHGWTVYLLPWQRRRQAELLEASRPAYIFASPQTEQTIFALSPQLKALIDHAYEPLSSSDQGTWYRLFGEAKGTCLSPAWDTVSEPEGSVALSGDP